MNYLAHLFLAEDTPESLMGNLAGDFVKGALGERFPAAIRQGIIEHRRIDEFTDTHPAVAAFRRVIAEEQGHYCGVISDVFLDHFLISDWNEYSTESLDEFLLRVFTALDTVADQMPGDLVRVYPHMRDGNWMRSYAHTEGIRMALRGLSRRFSRAPRLDEATHLLTGSRTTLHAHFRSFFPDVMAYAKTIRSQP